MAAAAAGRRRRLPVDVRAGYLLLAPALAVMFLINVYPILYSLYVSLHQMDLKRPLRTPFVGLQNFADVLGSYYFWYSLKNTAALTVPAVLLVTALGLLAALLLHHLPFGRGWILPVFLVPWAVPSVATGLTWKWIYDPEYGALNGLLYSLGVIAKYQVWLGDPVRAMPLVVNAFVWKELPLAGLLFLTTLQSIPGELYEAALVDGAAPLARFWYITLPSLRPAFLLVLLYETMLGIRAFDLIYILTEGGPGDATAVAAWFTYTETFRSLNFGRGTALSYIIALLTFGLAWWYIRLLALREER